MVWKRRIPFLCFLCVLSLGIKDDDILSVIGMDSGIGGFSI